MASYNRGNRGGCGVILLLLLVVIGIGAVAWLLSNSDDGGDNPAASSPTATPRRDPDDRLNFRSHDVVVWTQKPAYRDGLVSFAGRLPSGASLAKPDDDSAMQGGPGNFTINNASGDPLGSILIPPVGNWHWNLDDPGDVIAERYVIDANGRFEISFRWPDAIGDYTNKHITVWGYNNAERTAVLNSRADPLGESMVRLSTQPTPTAQPAVASAAVSPTATPAPAATPARAALSVAVTPTAAPTATLAPTIPVPTATPRPTFTPRPTATPRPTLLPHNTQNMRWVRQSHPDLYDAIAGLPWVQDGLNDADKDAIDQVLYMAASDALSAADAIVKFPWLNDTVTDAEQSVLKSLRSVAYRSADTADAIVAMPFLQTVDESTLHALRAINDILYTGNESALVGSRIYQSGITNEWAPVVAAAGTVAAPDAVAEYLNGQIAIHQERYDTDYTTDLTVTIVRPAGNAAGGTSPDLAARAVRLAENIMRMPLPTDNVIVVVDDRSGTGNFFGVNHGFAIGIKQKAETSSPERLLNLLVHEVAHYWWRGNADWIDEGIADTIAATASAQQGHTAAASPNRRRNCIAVNIGDIGDAPRDGDQFRCNYYLGEKLFRELQENTTRADFVGALQQLYQLSQEQPTPQNRDEYRAGIAQVRQAFPNHAAIIDRHYSGDLNAPHRWDPDDNLTFTTHNAVVWQQKPTYRNGIVRFEGYLQGSATLSQSDYESARSGGSPSFSINDSNGQWLGSILIRLDGNRSWNLDDPGDVVADYYAISKNAFAISFQWPDALGDYADKHITIWGYNNAERTPTITRYADPLGKSTVR